MILDSIGLSGKSTLSMGALIAELLADIRGGRTPADE